MAGCKDQHFRQLLHLYELDMMTEDQTAEFEQHLMDCDECLEAVQSFESVSEALRHSAPVREEVQRLSEDTSEESRSHEKSGSGWWRYVAVIAAIVIIAVIRPWRLEFAVDDPVVAAEDRIAVLGFVEHSDQASEANLGRLMSSLLTTDLSQSSRVRVVSYLNMLSLSERIGLEPDQLAAPEFREEIVAATGARWLVQGEILEVDSIEVVSAQLSDAESGEVMMATTLEMESSEQIYAVVDSLTILIKAAIPLLAGAEEEYDPQIASVTTASPEAYALYLEGLELAYKMYRTEAVEKFDAAVALDSTFAMAWYHIARLQRPQVIEQAMQHSEHATEKEQLYIRGLAVQQTDQDSLYVQLMSQIIESWPDEKDAHYYLATHWYNRGQARPAIDLLNQAIAIDPHFKVAYNSLAYAYQLAEVHDSAIIAINRYIELAPGEPNPYDTRGDLYTYQDRIEGAIESYSHAVAIKRDFARYASLIKLAHLYRFFDREEDARDIYQELEQLPERRSAARYYLATLLAEQGRLERTIEKLRLWIAVEMRDSLYSSASYKHRLLAFTFSELDMPDSAMVHLDRFMYLQNELNPGAMQSYRCFKVGYLARMGRQVEAEALVEAIRQHHDTMTHRDDFPYYFAIGTMQFARGEYAAAAESFDSSAAYYDIYPTRFLQGRALLEAGKLSEAVKVLERLAFNYTDWRISSGSIGTKVNYYLGLAYERSNWNEQALEQYRTYATRRAASDYDDPLLVDAKARIAKLEAL